MSFSLTFIHSLYCLFSPSPFVSLSLFSLSFPSQETPPFFRDTHLLPHSFPISFSFCLLYPCILSSTRYLSVNCLFSHFEVSCVSIRHFYSHVTSSEWFVLSYYSSAQLSPVRRHRRLSPFNGANFPDLSIGSCIRWTAILYNIIARPTDCFAEIHRSYFLFVFFSNIINTTVSPYFKKANGLCHFDDLPFSLIVQFFF